jgi:DNA-binding NtrC family response regulator
MPNEPSEVATRERKRPHVDALGSGFEIVIVEGPDQGLRLVLDGDQPGRALIGQSSACHLRITDRLVSRRHLAVDPIGTTLKVFDLRSKNGTFVNGVNVVEANLHGGELVRIGDTVLSVGRTSAAPAPRDTRDGFGRMLGRSDAMRALYATCDRLCSSDVPVVVEGETGTGKELLAECLHEASSRASGPFIVMDCTAVAARDVEATLFGVDVPGDAPRPGLFEQADGGTLLVDEIAELDAQVQPKLLRAIERGEVIRVGGHRRVTTNVRVIATTRRDLDREVQAGRFRDDLFYRLAVTRLELPPLRRRIGDVPLLATHFWRALSHGRAPPPDLVERLEDLEWPGNVRELANAVARRFALGDLAPASTRATGTSGTSGTSAEPTASTPRDLVERILELDLPLTASRDQLVEDFERRYVARVLARHGGNVARAAESSGLARRYFQILRARQAR